MDVASAFKFDFDVRINVRNIRDGKDIEDAVFSHRLVLSTASPLFHSLLLNASDGPLTSIDVDLRLVPNGLAAFKAVLGALYTGDVQYTEAQPAQVLCVARACQVSSVESKILASSLESNPLFYLMQPPVFANTAVHSYLQSLLAAMYIQQGSENSMLTSPTSTEDSGSRVSVDSSPRGSPQELCEKVLPIDDKDGWCRNKKYIEKVDNGFMCTVCRKVYGRYNSVSYHVTIYHRNPPIRCDEPGCQFSTREARYIHFHKYYRHQIALPESIDLGSRKCPHCRHVSKSPAMLEKHMARHQQERKEISTSFLEHSTSLSSDADVTPTSLPNMVPVIQMLPPLMEPPKSIPV